jgi:transportin-1
VFKRVCIQAKNLLILYDAVSTLADSVGHELNKPEHIQVLLPPLFERWRLLPDDHKDLMPLLECMTSVVQALGLGFQPFAAEERAPDCVVDSHRTLARAMPVRSSVRDRVFGRRASRNRIR